MKRVGVVVKIDAEAGRKANELENWLNARGVEVVYGKSLMAGVRQREVKSPTAPAGLACVFVLGGDGTFLSAVRWTGDQDIPIMGVKFGEVGFLAETEAESLFAVAEEILDGRYSISTRMRLEVEILREGEKRVRETALNDVVINKGALARLARIETYIDDRHLTTYKADGLIVATPTGSTAYSMAAGGPIIHPDVPGIIMTPICPFTLTNRPLIVPDTACIKMRLGEKTPDIILTFDGQAGFEIDDRDTILVRKHPHPVRMITMPSHEYFDVLKAKLRWSGSRV
ncbi:MAG: NAD(+)/NADH kinase [Desulfobacterales bacterium]|nr:NAD(+)/NADH kinase [Desulfobacterales bacterium]